MKFIKMWNPGYPDREFELKFVKKETDDQYITHYNRCDKKSDKVLNSCLKYRLATQEEIDAYITELKQLKIYSDSELIDDIRRFSISYLKEDLCSDGRKIWYIAERYIQKEIESQGLGRKFLFMQGKELYIAISKDDHDVDYEFRYIHPDMIELNNSEPVIDNWWENKENFPCMLICNFSSGDELAWVHYAIDDCAYDCRDNAYEFSQYSNWRRATKQEILNNIKGL